MSGLITLETTQNVDLQLQLAPLGERVLACLIDGFIRGALGIGVIFFYSWIASAVSLVTVPGRVFAVSLLVILLIPVLFYHLLFEVLNNGQSPGKRAFDLRVVSLHGDTVSIGAYLLRWLFRLIDFHLFSGLVALIAVATSTKGQRIGDMVAGTTVVKESRPVQFGQLAYDETPPAYEPKYPEAENLHPAHIELIKETLDHPDTSASHVELLAGKTARIMGVEFTEPSREFLRIVVKDYSGTSRMR